MLMGRLIEIDRAGDLQLVLSERNLLSLLSKLYTEGSAATIVCGDVPPGYAPITISAEKNDIHYSSATREGEPAGEMHPVTEKILERLRYLGEEGLKI